MARVALEDDEVFAEDVRDKHPKTITTKFGVFELAEAPWSTSFVNYVQQGFAWGSHTHNLTIVRYSRLAYDIQFQHRTHKTNYSMSINRNMKAFITALEEFLETADYGK